MRLSEIKVVGERLPFDIEIAINALANGEKLFMHDVAFGEAEKHVRKITIKGPDNYDFLVDDPDASFSPRNIVYPRLALDNFKLGKNDRGNLLLTYNDEDEA